MTKATVAVAFFIVLTRVLGFGEKLAIAAVFGTDWGADTWFVVVSVPTFLFLFTRELCEPVFLPGFVAHVDKGDDSRAMGFFRFFAKPVALLVGGVALVTVLWPGTTLELLAPGFDPSVAESAIPSLRLAAVCSPILALSTLTYASLNAERRFALPASGDVLLKLGPLVGCLLLAPSIGILGLVVGLVVGSCARLGLHLFGLRRRLPGLRNAEPVPSEERRQLRRLLAPLIVGSLFAQVSELFDNYFSTLTGEGGVAARNFAKKLCNLPLEVGPYALSVALFPTFAALAARGENDRLQRLLGRSIHGLVLVFAPVALILLLHSEPIVSTALERGAFDAESRRSVAFPLRMYGFGIIAFAVETVLVNYWFAMRDTRTPIVVGIVCVALDVALCALLVGPLDIGGVALALTISKTAKVIILCVLLPRLGLTFHWVEPLGATLRILLAATIGAMALIAFRSAVSVDLGESGLTTRALVLLGGAAAGGTAFAAVILVIGTAERALVRDGLALVRQLVSRRKSRGSP